MASVENVARLLDSAIKSCHSQVSPMCRAHIPAVSRHSLQIEAPAMAVTIPGRGPLGLGVNMRKRATTLLRNKVVGGNIRPVQRREHTYKLLAEVGPVIYAIRTGDDLIKIGYTTDLASRQRNFGKAQLGEFGHILAARPGTRQDEQAIHQRLKGLAARGWEYYPWRPEVVAVVNEMRASLGLGPLDEADR